MIFPISIFVAVLGLLGLVDPYYRKVGKATLIHSGLWAVALLLVGVFFHRWY